MLLPAPYTTLDKTLSHYFISNVFYNSSVTYNEHFSIRFDSKETINTYLKPEIRVV